MLKSVSSFLNKIKIPLIIIAFFILGFILAFSLFYNKKSPPEKPYVLPGNRDMMVDWQTYTDNEIGFTISYPQTAQINEQDIYPPGCTDGYQNEVVCKEKIDNTGIIKKYSINGNIGNQNPPGYLYIVGIVLDIYKKDVSLEKWVNDKYKNSVFCTPVSFDYISGFMCSDTKSFYPRPDIGFKKIFLKQNGLIFSFESGDSSIEDLANQIRLYEAIISTFKI
jgi:hypothetical protein